MSEERHYTIVRSSTPRWVGIAVGALAMVSLGASGAAWMASSRSSALEQDQATRSQQFKQQEDALDRRIARAEDTNAQLRGELRLVTSKMKLTQGELTRARRTAAQIKDANARQLADLQTNLKGQLATKANVDDVNKIGTDVDGIKTDLEATKNGMKMTRDEFGTLIAKNHDEIEELRRVGDRDYYEFTINKKGRRQRVGDVMVELRGVNTRQNLYTVSLYIDDSRYDKKNRSVNEPIYFFTHGKGRAPMEFVVNQVGKNRISGYLSVLKSQSAHAQSAGN
ncbi:MAG TPA: hypothetical protein VI216_04740 [Candidatus Acidoferrales bacterium]